MVPDLRFHHTDGGFGGGAVDAFACQTICEMSADALLASLPRVRVHQHVVRADELIIVRSENNSAGSPGLLLPLLDLKNDGGRELIIEVIEMAHIRRKVIENEADLLSGLRAESFFALRCCRSS